MAKSSPAEEDRQAWLKARQQGKIARRELTDALADYITSHPELSDNAKVFLYANVTNSLYLGLCGRSASKLKQDWGIEKPGDNPRNHMEGRELSKLEALEDLCSRLIDQGYEPMKAAKEALARLFYKKISR